MAVGNGLRIATRLLLSAVFFGLVSIYLLGYAFGDVDDWGRIFFGVGAVMGLFVGYLLRHSEVPRSIVWKVNVLLVLAAASLIAIGYVGLVSGRNPITAARYEELEGLIPLFILLSGSIPSVLALLLWSLRARPK